MRGKIMRFDEIKTETLNLRVAPSFKKVLKAVADAENRSMMNMLEVILFDYCERHGTNVKDAGIATTTDRKRMANARNDANGGI
jgi:hypothetical protein